MALKERIDNDLKAALLGGNRFVCEILRGAKAVILNEEVSLGKRDDGLDDVAIEKLLAREVKKRHESAKIYDNASRSELAENERAEATILEAYLPRQLSEDELKTVILKIKKEHNFDNSGAMGQLIGLVKKEVGTTADGSVIARLVKNELK